MKRLLSALMFVLLLVSMLVISSNFQSVKSELETIVVPDDFATIQQAINAANPSATIFVKSGTYAENIVVNKPLSLIGSNKLDTFIDGNGTGSVVEVTSNFVTLAGFTLQHSGSSFPDSGILLEMTSECNVSHNIITDDAFGILLFGCSRNIFDDNVVLDSSCAIELYVGNSENVFANNNCSNNLVGFLVAGASDNIFMNNIVSNGNHGFVVGWNSRCNTFCGNVVSDIGWGGFRIVDGSSGNQVLGNEVFNCLDGIELTIADNNIVMGNNVVHMGRSAISFSRAHNNVVAGNEILNNGYGFVLEAPCSNNTIYHNNVINNTQQVSLIFSPANNSWDNGYLSGGNCWSDYVGEDANGDGIGDTPYIINEQNKDDYPLALPYSTHEIGIISVKTSKSAVWQGYPLDVNVIMANYGSNDEIFNLTLYTGGTPNKNQSTTLQRRTATILTFTWNTTDFAYGNYSISAYASPVEGETYTSDNTFVDGWVIVTISGDVNGDGKVDIYDIVTACASYGSKEGDPNWNLDADLAPPWGTINIYDIVTIASHYGQIIP